MKNISKKLIVILGPTASGKTDLAIFLAKKFCAELISADSRQVYVGLDIGAGKDKSYPQYLLDICDPVKETYTVADFQRNAYKTIFDIFSRGKMPILVGGSGLYIDAVTKGYKIPKTSLKLRAELEKLPYDEVLEQLNEYDPESYKKIDHKNKRRILRALESSIVNRKPFSSSAIKKPDFETLFIGINLPRQELYQRIDERLQKRLDQGMVKEVERLLKKGVPHEKLQKFGLEYRYIDNYLQEPTKENYQKQIEALKFKIHAFARRQLTWFRRNKNIHWVENSQEAEKLVNEFLNAK